MGIQTWPSIHFGGGAVWPCHKQHGFLIRLWPLCPQSTWPHVLLGKNLEIVGTTTWKMNGCFTYKSPIWKGKYALNQTSMRFMFQPLIDSGVYHFKDLRSNLIFFGDWDMFLYTIYMLTLILNGKNKHIPYCIISVVLPAWLNPETILMSNVHITTKPIYQNIANNLYFLKVWFTMFYLIQLVEGICILHHLHHQ